MVIIHADGQTATNLNMFDNIVNIGKEIVAERITGGDFHSIQLGLFDTTEECEKRFNIIAKNWAYGCRFHDMNESIEDYE